MKGRFAVLHTKLATAVKAVRLRYAISFILLLIAVYWIGIHPWMTNWGSSLAEQQMGLPGDDLNPIGAAYSTKAITINAPPNVVWQWLAQVGQDRAGFYTYTWLENLIGADIHNSDEIHPEWQHLVVGDVWRLAPPGFMGQDMADPVLLIEPGRVIALKMFGAHVIVPVGENTARLLVRGQSGPANLLTIMLVDPLVFTMERRMLLGVKARAEGRPDASPALMAVAHIGWIAAGLIITGLFLSQGHRRYWIFLCVVATLPALLMAQDVQAALAAFLSVGITVLGFLIFGRDWWGPLLIIASLVLLTLLLAPEAYIAIGLAFVLLLAALGVTMAERSRAQRGTANHMAASTR
jgi:hypothetical protein